MMNPTELKCFYFHQSSTKNYSLVPSASRSNHEKISFEILCFMVIPSLCLFKYGCFVHDNEFLLSHNNNNNNTVLRPFPFLLLPGRRIISFNATKMWIIIFTQNFIFISDGGMSKSDREWERREGKKVLFRCS